MPLRLECYLVTCLISSHQLNPPLHIHADTLKLWAGDSFANLMWVIHSILGAKDDQFYWYLPFIFFCSVYIYWMYLFSRPTSGFRPHAFCDQGLDADLTPQHWPSSKS